MGTEANDPRPTPTPSAHRPPTMDERVAASMAGTGGLAAGRGDGCAAHGIVAAAKIAARLSAKARADFMCA